MKKSLSAYSEATTKEELERHIMVVWVDNEAGVLARVSGLFSGRGYNIESLTVAQVDEEKNISRITIVTNGTNSVIEQIKAQLLKLIPVYKVASFPVDDKSIFRELALIKVITDKKNLEKAKEICNSYIEVCLSKVSLFPDSIYKIKIQNIVKEVSERKG